MKKIKDIYKMPNCKICNNTRVVDYISARLGKRTKSCICTKYKKNLKMLKCSRIPDCFIEYEIDDYANLDRSNYKDVIKNYVNKTVENVRSLLNDKCQIVREKSYDIMFAGHSGTGKTVLAVATLKKMILDHGYSGMFVTGEELVLMAIGQSKFNAGEIVNGISIDKLLEVDFLLIDGYEALLQEKLFSTVKIIIDGIIKQRKNDKKCFIITVNRDVSKSDELSSELTYRLIPFILKGSVVKIVTSSRKKDIGF